MTTQPIEWDPPSTATIFELQPLSDLKIEKFLLGLADLYSETDKETFTKRARSFLSTTLASNEN